MEPRRHEGPGRGGTRASEASTAGELIAVRGRRGSLSEIATDLRTAQTPAEMGERLRAIAARAERGVTES
jgi:hypothetical protein